MKLKRLAYAFVGLVFVLSVLPFLFSLRIGFAQISPQPTNTYTPVPPTPTDTPVPPTPTDTPVPPTDTPPPPTNTPTPIPPPPVLSHISIIPLEGVAQVNTNIDATAAFTIPNLSDIDTATWDWGDGNASTCALGTASTACSIDPGAGSVGDGEVSGGVGDGEVSGSHTYTDPGVYTVQLTLLDKLGQFDTSDFEFLIVYDPSDGFVTGGGWIWSEPGWCQIDAMCAAAEGKASFGFVSKYKRGATVPSGHTEFQFEVADLTFHSDTYHWLVVNRDGANAQFKGEGTINGAVAPGGDNYRFMIWATDGDPDTFRIRIWYEDGSSEVIVYDNGFNQPIGGGSILIHQANKAR